MMIFSGVAKMSHLAVNIIVFYTYQEIFLAIAVFELYLVTKTSKT